MPKKLVQGILLGAAAAFLSLVLWYTGALDTFEGRTWDIRVRELAEPEQASDKVFVILLDQKSLDWGKEENGLSWPWPREVYTYILNFLHRGEPAAVVFDVLYTEPSSYGVYDDEVFAGAIASTGNFVGTVFLSSQGSGAESWPEGYSVLPLSLKGRNPAWLKDLHYSRGVFPIPEIAGAVRTLANVHLIPDQDGIFRRSKLFYLQGETVVPSMALAAYLLGRGAGEQDLTVDTNRIAIGDTPVPVDRKGNMILRYRGPSATHTTFNAAEIILSEIALLSGETPDIDPEMFRDSYIFFGFSAPGLMDLRPVPTAEVYPGVEVHATMLDNILTRDAIRPMPDYFFILCALVLGIGAGAGILSGNKTYIDVALYILLMLLPVVLAALLYRPGIWVPLAALELTAVVALVGSGFLKFATEGQQKRFIKNAFRQYLSPDVIEELISDPESLTLGGERRELTMFFSDLQGFTAISETLSPEDLTALLNEYLSAMTDIIQEQGGTIDKFEGDAIIAFWNAPLDMDDHAVRGVRAALLCQDTLKAMRPVLKERTGKELLMRIGLNTGYAVVGNMGSRTRFDYTMLGDAVNLAARLEGVNKQFDTYTMISGDTRDIIKGVYPTRELSRVAVVGRKEPVIVFEPMLEKDFEGKKEVLKEFDRALRLFYRGAFEEARSIFSAISRQDPPAGRYAEKCTRLLEHPPAEWQGVWVMTEK